MRWALLDRGIGAILQNGSSVIIFEVLGLLGPPRAALTCWPNAEAPRRETEIGEMSAQGFEGI